MTASEDSQTTRRSDDSSGGSEPSRLIRGLSAKLSDYEGSECRTPTSESERHETFLDDLEVRVKHLLEDGEHLPSSLGPYDLGGVLGIGGMGLVIEGRHRETGGQVALKVASSRKPKFAEALKKEAHSLDQVSSPSIVKFLNAGEESGFVWLATEFISGSDLQKRIHGNRLRSRYISFEDTVEPEGNIEVAHPGLTFEEVITAVSWFRTLALAIDKLHKADLVHRDINPRNIIIDEQGHPMLIDLGLSIDVNESFFGVLAGTFPYMSPEQTLMGALAVGPASDIYSLSVTFAEVLSGNRIVTEHGMRALKDVAFTQVPRVSTLASWIPRSLDPIFERALQKDPERRYPTGQDLADQLDGWIDEQRNLLRHPRWRRRVVAGVIIVLVVSIALLILLGRPPKVYEEIGALLGKGEAEAALQLALAHYPQHESDDQFIGLVDRAVARAAPQRTKTMLKSLAFSGAAPDDATHVARYASDARKLLARTSDENLVFQLAFSHLMTRGEAPRGLNLLERHGKLTRGSPLLVRIKAILHLAVGDEAGMEKALAQPAARELLDTETELCLESFRKLWRHEGKRMATNVDLEDLEKRLTAALVKRSGTGAGPRGTATASQHLLILTFRCRVLYELDQHEDALRDFTSLLEERLTETSDLTVMAFASASSAIVAARMAREPEFENSVRRAIKVCQTSPGAIHFIARQIYNARLPPEFGFRWLKAVLASVPASGIPAGTPLFVLATKVSASAFMSGQDYASVIAVLRDTKIPAPYPPGSEFGKILKMNRVALVWSGHNLSCSLVEEGRHDDARELAAMAVNIAKNYAELHPAGDTEVSCVGGLACATLSALARTDPDRIMWGTRARLHLENALTDIKADRLDASYKPQIEEGLKQLPAQPDRKDHQ